MGNFSFLSDYSQFKMFSDAAIEAEKVLKTSPSMSAIGSRKALELVVKWMYSADKTLGESKGGLQDMVHKAEFEAIVDPVLLRRLQYIIRLGNRGVHTNETITVDEATESLNVLFNMIRWVDYTYGEDYDYDRVFDLDIIPDKHVDVDIEEVRRNQSLLRKSEQEIESLRRAVEELSEKYTAEREKNRLSRQYRKDDITEFETRQLYIDMDLKRMGWILEGNDANVVLEMELNDGSEFADYVLFGKDGLPLAVVEAKRTSADPNQGRVQASMYADSIEKQYGRRPMMFTTNGFETFFWDDASGPQRRVSGVFSRDDLQRLMNRRTGSKDPMQIPISDDITDRYYQKEAIRSVCSKINDCVRKHLIVMATGTGKTRTAASLVDVLSRASLVTNILFLADRTELVKQAKNDFEKYLPDMTLCNLCVNKKDADARMVFSTYPTILNAIDDMECADGVRIFTPAHFDLIIVDESHRSIFRKYRAIFDYFDSQIVGLTATPKTEVDRNTYGFFDMENGIPTFAYDYDTAVGVDHVLVPYMNFEVKTKFMEDGIIYVDLPESERARYEDDFIEDDVVPEEIPSNELNKFVFNRNTVDMVLQDLMNNGIRVGAGEYIGKTIIFAQNKRHAEYILERFNILYPEYKGLFAERVICDDSRAEQIIADFKQKDGMQPQIVVSVDMMDTGIDVPDCVNLVFFKVVRSKTKFWQMIGRGTRLHKDGSYQDSIDGSYTGKRRFFIFDYCGNFEFFRENVEGFESGEMRSLSQRSFENRVRLISALQHADYSDDEHQAIRESLVITVRGQIDSLNRELTPVRLKLRYVEKYGKSDSLVCINDTEVGELVRELAPIIAPEPGDEMAKIFDNLMYTLMLVFIQGGRVGRIQKSVMRMAEVLKGKSTIPQVKAKLNQLDQITSDEFWSSNDVLVAERLRDELRELMQFIDKPSVKTVYTDLTDEVLSRTEGGEPIQGYDFADYKERVNRYVREHSDDPVIHKLNHNIPLTHEDFVELERIFTEELGNREDYQREYGGMGFGLLIRSIVKLDHNAVMEAFSSFINDESLNQEQIRFVHKIIQYLETEGTMEIGDLMEKPFDKPVNITKVFSREKMSEIADIINTLNGNAMV